ncbi:MAG: zinc ribbon domain-containing protein [Gemmataceae bacterium]|nr:zinc ribbon domain-containing protein [Gemmataceae bacterium]
MAMYEFVCQKCNQEFEQLVFSGEIAACPGCKSTRLEKKWSLPSRPGNQDKNSYCETNLPPCNPNCCKMPSNVRR